MIQLEEVTGLATTHLETDPSIGKPVHKATVAAFLKLREAAARDGVDIVAMSGFRGFEQQAAIWNAKWDGQRTLYDKESRPVDHASLSPPELARTILLWSALPGASRHHWGTDIDVYDGRTKPESYAVQLLPAEYEAGGYFHDLHKWLVANMGRYGFFFPYREDRGGISVEPWHISHAPVSVPALESLTVALLEQAVSRGDIHGRDTVLDMLPEIHRRYVKNICPPGPEVAME